MKAPVYIHQLFWRVFGEVRNPWKVVMKPREVVRLVHGLELEPVKSRQICPARMLPRSRRLTSSLRMKKFGVVVVVAPVNTQLVVPGVIVQSDG